MANPKNFISRLATTILPLWLPALNVTGTIAHAQPSKQVEDKSLKGLTAAEFSRLSRESSEEGGVFPSDNFTSNETSYLTVVDKLHQLGAQGGAYLGVGPEQNFTYIAKIRPRIAFIVDIRREALLQQLMYKAIFQLSPDRVRFLSMLLCRPLPKTDAVTPASPLNDILSYFSRAAPNYPTYTANLRLIRTLIQKELRYPLSEHDQKVLEQIYGSFRQFGMQINYRSNPNNSGPIHEVGRRSHSFGSDENYPTLGDLIAQTDRNGKTGNFLAHNDDYAFVRNLQRKNMIIPVVGNFAGTKALSAIGDYLRNHKYTVTAYYLSNVEQFLFEGELFRAWAENVRKLPITNKSIFIRATSGPYYHPAVLPGHNSVTLLQSMETFLKDFDEGLYKSYKDLVLSKYIPILPPGADSDPSTRSDRSGK